jgi:hypothetical protein
LVYVKTFKVLAEKFLNPNFEGLYIELEKIKNRLFDE